MILRNFLYLDSDTLNDYLSTIQGYLPEGTISETTKGKRTGGVGVDLKVIKAGGDIETGAETTKLSQVTDSGNFQSLYEMLIEEKMIRSDTEIVDNSFVQGELVEIQLDIKLPQFYKLLSQANRWSSLYEALSPLEPSFKAQKVILDMMTNLSEALAGDNIAIIGSRVKSTNFKILSYLYNKYILRGITSLEGISTVIGKVQTVLRNEDSYEAFSVIPSLESLSAVMKEEDLENLKSQMEENKYRETVKGPGIILSPLAVYR